MEGVHNIFYQFDLLLACNFLDKDDQAMVIEKAKVKWRSKSLETKESSEAKNVKVFQEIVDNEDKNKFSIKQTSPKTFEAFLEKENKIQISDLVQANLVDPRTHFCKNCDYKTKHKHNMKVHAESKHKGVKYKCNQCEYTGTKYGLKDHERAKHGGKLFVCKLCDYATSYKSALNSHKKAQHEGVSFQCDLCDQKFHWRSGLKAHRDTKHSKQLYACDQCDYSASTPRSLAMHIKVKHERVKFECKQCGSKVFHLRDHEKRFHVKPPQVLSGCEISVI